jgi:hypothetical protein
MANYWIEPYIPTCKRVAFKVETTEGTDIVPADADSVRAMKVETKQAAPTRLSYAMPRGIASAMPSALNRLHRSVNMQLPFYLPTGATDAAAVLAFHTKVLTCAGFAAAVVGDVTEFTPITAYASQKSASIYVQHATDTWKHRGAKANLKLNFGAASENSCMYDLDWLAMCTQRMPCMVSGANTDGEAAVAQLAYPTDPGALPAFAAASVRVWPNGDSMPATYLACKEHTYDAGIDTFTCDDGSGTNGITRIHAVRDVSKQKVTFDFERPATHDLWPYIKYWTAGTILNYYLRLVGGTETSHNYGIQIEGCLQLTDDVAESEDKVGRIKLGGVLCPPAGSSTEPIKISIGKWDVA